jgi:hypothetical protein
MKSWVSISLAHRRAKTQRRVSTTVVGVPEHFAPTPERLVGGHDHGSALVAGGHELEEQVGGLGLERYVANLVDDQKGDAAKLK